MTEEILGDLGMNAALAARLENIAREVARDWGLMLGPRIEAGRYSYVAPAGDEWILKVIPAEDDSASQQAEALEVWDGDGAVRLVRHDPGRRVLLLERVVPGTEAAAVDEDESIAAAIAVGRRIWRRVPADRRFPTIDEDVARYLPREGRHPLVAAARRAYESLTARSETLIHADFQHHNVLRRGSEWVVIDPKPMAGEPEYDIPTFLWNPWGQLPTQARTERRIRAFADAGLDGDRIRAWTIVRGVMLGLPTRARDAVNDDRPQFHVVRQLI